MYKIIFILTLTLITNFKQTAPQNAADYILLFPDGEETAHIRPLYISTKKIVLTLSPSEITMMTRYGQYPVTKERIEAFTEMRYSRVVTNQESFSQIAYFIKTHSKFYVSEEHRNPMGIQFYVAEVNGKRFEVFYKKTESFFKELEEYLKAKKSNKSVIKAIHDQPYEPYDK